MYYDDTTLITDVHEINVLVVSRHVVRCEVLSVIDPSQIIHNQSSVCHLVCYMVDITLHKPHSGKYWQRVNIGRLRN